MDKRILLLRICYWMGIVIDAAAALLMLNRRFVAFTGVPPAGLEGLVVDAGSGAALMIGWTFLLFWADRKPMERRGTLLLTVFPVLFGLIANEVQALAAGVASPGSTVPILVLQGVLVSLFSLGYFSARHAAAADAKRVRA